jgi:phenylacetate-CoA ligase
MWFSLVGAGAELFRYQFAQYWRSERLEAYRNSQLTRTLAAAARIPFYADRFRGIPRADELAKLPILHRADIAMLNRSVREMHGGANADFICAQSSGTSGHGIDLIFDASHQRSRFAARARYLIANGWRPWHRTAWLIGLTPGPDPDYQLTRLSIFPGFRFMSHIEEFSRQADFLLQFDPHFIYTLPSNLEAILMVLETRDARLPSLHRIFTGGEVLEDSLRNRTRQILGVEISDNYGSTEVFVAWQCRFGAYHINSEHALVEIVDDDGNPVKPREMGRVLVTTLQNHLMPLVRYEMGDYALALDGDCGCGRTLPRIGNVVGRGINLFRSANGKLISPWNALDAVKEIPGLKQVQIVQQHIDRYLVRMVCDLPLAPQREARAREHLLHVLGQVHISFEMVDNIARTPRGKFMSALCELDVDETGDDRGDSSNRNDAAPKDKRRG